MGTFDDLAYRRPKQRVAQQAALYKNARVRAEQCKSTDAGWPYWETLEAECQLTNAAIDYGKALVEFSCVFNDLYKFQRYLVSG